MAYTRQRSRKEAALLGVHDGRNCIGTIVPVGIGTIDAVERPYVIFDQHDRRVGSCGGYREALRADSSRGRAS